MAMAVSTCSTEIPSPLPLIVGQLHPTVNASCTADVPTKFDLVVSASYAGKCNGSSIVDGKMLLGFLPVGLSLRKLQGDRMLIQVETKNNRDLFNLESGSLSKSASQKNITFSFEQEFPVFNIKSASVLIYDHYEIDEHVLAEYSTACRQTSHSESSYKSAPDRANCEWYSPESTIRMGEDKAVGKSGQETGSRNPNERESCSEPEGSDVLSKEFESRVPTVGWISLEKYTRFCRC
ncbi:unnamed protein product [Caretta caretta]